MDLELMKKKLVERGYKITKQRELIFETLFESQGEHLSPEEIHELESAAAALETARDEAAAEERLDAELAELGRRSAELSERLAGRREALAGLRASSQTLDERLRADAARIESARGDAGTVAELRAGHSARADADERLADLTAGARDAVLSEALFSTPSTS